MLKIQEPYTEQSLYRALGVWGMCVGWGLSDAEFGADAVDVVEFLPGEEFDVAAVAGFIFAFEAFVDRAGGASEVSV